MRHERLLGACRHAAQLGIGQHLLRGPKQFRTTPPGTGLLSCCEMGDHSRGFARAKLSINTIVTVGLPHAITMVSDAYATVHSISDRGTTLEHSGMCRPRCGKDVGTRQQAACFGYSGASRVGYSETNSCIPAERHSAARHRELLPP